MSQEKIHADNQKTIFENLPTTSNALLEMLNKSEQAIVKEMRETPQHSIYYYNALLSLFNRIILDVFTRKIFDAPVGWYYSLEISNRIASICLKHISSSNFIDGSLNTNNPTEIFYDEKFSIINFPVENLSVEDYAKRIKTEPVTIRQWIRRGKLRNAFRIGGEWRIPSISDIPSRGYSAVTYHVNGEWVNLPKAFFSSGIGICNIAIEPKGKGFFLIHADGNCMSVPPRLFTDQERIELEQVLLNNPNITNSESIVGIWPKINEKSELIPVRRRGGMRQVTE